jgi:hypothetical protein
MMLNMAVFMRTTDTRSLPVPRQRRSLLAPLLLLLLLAACAPRAVTPSGNSAERAAQDTALIIYHRMQLGHLQTGTYTTNVLVDVDLPRGLRWTIESFPGETYELRVSDDALPGLYWEVTPAGVRRVQSVSGGQTGNMPAALRNT